MWQATSAAVSVRNLDFPKLMGIKPFSVAFRTSSSLKSPSGPISTRASSPGCTILQKRFFAFITVGDEFLTRKRLCDELVEVCHFIQLGQACLERLLDGGNQNFGDALRLDDFPFRETAVQECQFVKPNFRRFLGKPLCAVHILGRRHGNVQMTFPQGARRKGFQGYSPDSACL